MSERSRENEINKLRAWAVRKLKANIKKYKLSPAPVYKHGQTIRSGQEEYVLVITYKNKKTGSAHISNKNIILSLPKPVTRSAEKKMVPKLITRVLAR